MALSRRKLLVAAAAGIPLGAVLFSRKKAELESGAELVSSPIREISDVFPAQPTVDGAGVKLRRALGSQRLSLLDPFLLLDEIASDDPNDYIAGFPSHPHRGFETVTYMIHGAMEHKDSVGNHGHLGPGSAQWMTAGHGIVHSEMPQQENGLMWGYQLWVNLPARRKLIPPRYQDIAPERVPEALRERMKTRVVAGTAFEQTGPVVGIDVDPVFLDVALEQSGRFGHTLPPSHTAFVYVVDGAVRFGANDREVRRGELAVLSKGALLSARADAEMGRFFLLAGRPLNEPVRRSGPFVMNTDEELKQAWQDYKSGRLTQS